MIPPVGEPIIPRLRGGEIAFDWSFGGRYRPVFVDSGTTALRLAIETARRHLRTDGPTWIPAYGCPDIVTACLAAGSRPTLYDVTRESPFLAPGQAAPPGTIAIVAAHFLGLPHPSADIVDAARAAGALVIEDSAQRFPMAEDTLFGDMVVLSFGRGKPVSLMEGGCLLVADRLHECAVEAASRYGHTDTGLSGATKRRLHDLALRPGLYEIARRLPGLNVGRVLYTAVPSPHLTGPRFRQLAARAAASYRADTGWQERQHRTERWAAQHLPQLQRLMSRPAEPDRRLLRMPFLATGAAAAVAAVRRAHALGVGAGHLYGRALPDIDGAPANLDGPCFLAREFAARLVTLPILPADVPST